LPAPRAIGHLYDADPGAALAAAKAAGWVMASELLSCGLDLSFAPVVELDRGLADVIGDRAFHETAEGVTVLSMQYMAGMREAGMAATAKHFPTHAGVHHDSHIEAAVDGRDYPELFDDLEPYRHLIGAGLRAIMVGHVSFPRLDPLPASLSSWWLNTQLRTELGFSGVIVSDDLGMQGVAAAGTVPTRVQHALEAGCDLVLACDVPGDVPKILQVLDGYNNPPAQLRLMRLRGRGRVDWDELHASVVWARAIEALRRVEAKPDLDLEG
jgi:beta-N-acetylhexosaminidase